MTPVVDCSAVAKWILPDEHDDLGASLLRTVQMHGCRVPRHWHAELGNMVAQALRRRRLTFEEAMGVETVVAALDITVDPRDPLTLFAPTLDLARRHDLTYYDAAYLELALDVGAPLATFDRALVAACRRIAHPLAADLLSE